MGRKRPLFEKRSVEMFHEITHLFEIDLHLLPVLNDPRALLHFDLMAELAVDDGRLPLQPQRQLLLADFHVHVPRTDVEARFQRHPQLKHKHYLQINSLSRVRNHSDIDDNSGSKATGSNLNLHASGNDL